MSDLIFLGIESSCDDMVVVVVWVDGMIFVLVVVG